MGKLDQMPSADEIKKSIQERQISEGNEGKELSVEEYSSKIKGLSMEKVAEELNNAGCDNYTMHNLKLAVLELLNERYPASEGWEDFKGNNGYVDPLTKNNGDKQINLECTEMENGKFEWSWSE